MPVTDRSSPNANTWRCAAAALTLLLAGTPLFGQRPLVPDRLLEMGSVAVATASMDSLVQVILQTQDFSIQGPARIRLAQYGRIWAYHGLPGPVVVYPGVVARLRQIYPALIPQLRSTVVAGLSVQAEREEALAWLKELVKSPDVGANEIRIAEGAVEALARMGAAGEAELRRLHLSGEADEQIQDMLGRLAQTGYRRPPA